jgi:hypothetical protein
VAVVTVGPPPPQITYRKPHVSPAEVQMGAREAKRGGGGGTSLETTSLERLQSFRLFDGVDSAFSASLASVNQSPSGERMCFVRSFLSYYCRETKGKAGLQPSPHVAHIASTAVLPVRHRSLKRSYPFRRLRREAQQRAADRHFVCWFVRGLSTPDSLAASCLPKHACTWATRFGRTPHSHSR